MEIISRESYVIRIYRRYSDDLEKIHGLVEEIGTDEQKVFGSFSDLRKILLATGKKLKANAAVRSDRPFKSRGGT